MIAGLPELKHAFEKIRLKCLIVSGYIKVDYYYATASASAFAGLGQLAIIVFSSALFTIENRRQKSTTTLKEYIVK